MHWCTPCPNAACLGPLRAMSSRSGSLNAASSRFADPLHLSALHGAVHDVVGERLDGRLQLHLFRSGERSSRNLAKPCVLGRVDEQDAVVVRRGREHARGGVSPARVVGESLVIPRDREHVVVSADVPAAQDDASVPRAVLAKPRIHGVGVLDGTLAQRVVARAVAHTRRSIRCAVVRVLAGEAVRQFVGMSLAGKVGARVEQPLHGGRGLHRRFVGGEPGRVSEPCPCAGDVEDVLDAEGEARERPIVSTLQRRHVVVAAEGSHRVLERQNRHCHPGRRSRAGSRLNVGRPFLSPIRGCDSSATALCRSLLSITTRSADLPTSMP